MQALGMIEVIGLPPAIEAADSALKAANVTLLAIAKADAGILTVEITGDVGAVTAAVDAGAAAAERVGTLRAKHIIPHVDESLVGKVLKKGTKLFEPKSTPTKPINDSIDSGYTNSQADGLRKVNKEFDSNIFSIDSDKKEQSVQSEKTDDREENIQKRESAPKEDDISKGRILKEEGSFKDDSSRKENNSLEEDISLQKDNTLKEDGSSKDDVVKNKEASREDAALKIDGSPKKDAQAYKSVTTNIISQNHTNLGRDDIFGESTIGGNSKKDENQSYTVADLKKKSNDTLRAILQSQGVELTQVHKSAKKQELIQLIIAQQNRR